MGLLRASPDPFLAPPRNMAESTEQPFKIAVPEAELDFLRKKLELVRLPDELSEAGWDYGVPLTDVRRLVAYWKDGFDWRKAEAGINGSFPQYTRDIDIEGFGTLNIHYVHQKSTEENAIPLMFVHGWPGNFLEARKILPLLTAVSADHPGFHVVALSLPGFGFSDAPQKKGFGGPQYAEVAHKLMLAIGYKEYVVQAGDWGHVVAKLMAWRYGTEGVKAWHTNFPAANPPSFSSSPLLYLSHLITPRSRAERAGLVRTEWWRTKGGGYFHEQSTQPQTLGYSLADSPVGMLAWIYEKLVTWSDNYPWTDDEVLTWISIYWFSRAGPAASVRIYYEMAVAGNIVRPEYSSVPLGLSFFPRELIIAPKKWTRAIGRVVFEAEHDSGGHFASIEKPEELVEDVRRMFGKGGPAYGVVPGKTGYSS